MRVLFLLTDGFAIGGTVATTFNLAGALAGRGHEVEVLSSFRRRDVPQMPLHPAVRLVSLVELREDHPDFAAGDADRGKPPRHYPKADYRSAGYDLLIERRYANYLRNSDAEVVIATRAGLIAYAARLAPERMIRIGQEHLTRVQQRKAMRKELPRHLRRLDAYVTITARDAEDYRKHTRLGSTELTFIPNSVPAPGVPPSHGRDKIVVAAGRLVEMKRYDVLIRAFAEVIGKRPDWQLRIYGVGKLRDELRALIRELHVHNHVLLMGPYTPIDSEWAKGSIAAVPSDREPFGMTLVEAMRCGVPVVSTDAPYGPAEILDDGTDGVLTPVGDVDAMAAALLRLINDDAERQSMAAAALKNSQRYDPAPIAEQYEQLFSRLAARKAKSWRRWLRRAPATTPDPALGPAPTSTVPTVDVLVEPDGSLTLRPDAGLVWRRDGLVPDGLRGNGEDVTELTEGTYRLHQRDGEAVLAGSLDTRALIGWTGTRVQLPYRLADGGLGLRVTDRPVYAEVGDVTADGDGLHIAVRMIGAAAEDAVLELRGDKLIEVPYADGGFRITALPAGRWQAWVRYAGAQPAVRLGRHLDDVVHKDLAYQFPHVVGGARTMIPQYDANNDFNFRVIK
jgi:glycosyltransferase involved in cell wall biosynthesis